MDSGTFGKVEMNTLEDSLRHLAYSQQRTGNPRCESEAMEIHRRLDGVDEIKKMTPEQIIEASNRVYDSSPEIAKLWMWHFKRLESEITDRDKTIAELRAEVERMRKPNYWTADVSTTSPYRNQRIIKGTITIVDKGYEPHTSDFRGDAE